MDEAEKRVREELLTTWQPVAAIAVRARMPVRTALKVLVKLYNDGEVKMSYSRIDGHNKVHMFKKLEFTKIMGVMMPVDSQVEEV